MKLTKLSLFALTFAVVLSVAGYLLLQKKPAAPHLGFTTLQGERFTIANLRGKVVLVNFWATDCPGCIKEMPQLIETHNKYRAAGYETVAVAMYYDPPNYVLNFATKNALPFKVVLDVKGEAARAFGGVTLTPTSFIIDKKGRIIHKIIGEPDFAELHRLIEKKLSEKVILDSKVQRVQSLPQLAVSNGVTRFFKRA